MNNYYFLGGDALKKCCLVVNKDRDKDGNVQKTAEECLRKHGIELYIITESAIDGEKVYGTPDNIETIIVIGGDGTMIRAAKRFLKEDVPFYGINTGNVGFFTDVAARDAVMGLEKLINGEFRIENHMMLSVYCNGEYADTVLNEVVINRNGFLSIIGHEIFVNGESIDNIAGDGLIISTPTGSTGYNLAAGGAVAKPDTSLMLITPVCPHSLTSRCMIVSPDDLIDVIITPVSNHKNIETAATFDGRQDIKLKAGDKITIARSNYVTKLLRTDNMSFFKRVKSKIR